MTAGDGPNIITSGKSKRVVIEDCQFSVDIYRLETDADWTLEVVDPEGTHHVWDAQFSSDSDALDAAIQTIGNEGASAFMRGNNIIPFRPT